MCCGLAVLAYLIIIGGLQVGIVSSGPSPSQTNNFEIADSISAVTVATAPLNTSNHEQDHDVCMAVSEVLSGSGGGEILQKDWAHQGSAGGDQKPKGSKAKGNARLCAGCAKVEERAIWFGRCSKCRAVHYCSSECQHKHWSAHKESCVGAQAKHGAGAGGAGKSEFVSRELEGEECSICLEFVAASDFQLPCGHWYHRQCVKELRSHGGNEACPNCRVPLPPGPEEAADRAVRILVRAERIQAKHPSLAQQLFKEVQVLYQMAIKEAESCPAQWHQHLGIALQQQGDLTGAVASCRRAIAIDPEDSDAHSNLGNALQQQGDLTGAVASCRRAIAIDPEHANAHCNLG
ncbi:MAG TPA: tetratricopeptide repeat protein, partial [Flavobacteriales bacterium]|nr:tetratricopeptide repeat protein [Flavobacteriales bacterium]